MNESLLEKLACPRHKQKLELDGSRLVCPDGDSYSVIEGIPVLLFDDGRPAHGHIRRTLDQVELIKNGGSVDNVFRHYAENKYGVDEFVQEQLNFTCGNLYFAVQKNLTRYPFPESRLPPSNGRSLLDLGCSWGRWSIPAARKGYRVIGLDPHLDGALAARRISAKLGVEADFVVGDAVYLPFLDNSFDAVFSFSVLQHLAKSTVFRSLADIARITKPGGQVIIQMPNRFGLRSLFNRAKRTFQPPSEAHGDVFYWDPKELTREFSFHFGPTELSVDSYFGLNIQPSDADLMPLSHRTAIFASEIVRQVSRFVRPLRYVADSLYVNSVNKKAAIDQ